jgi:hypothetical protein
MREKTHALRSLSTGPDVIDARHTRQYYCVALGDPDQQVEDA